MGRGSVVQISVRPKVTLSQTSRLFIDILYIAAVVIVRTINSHKKYYLSSTTRSPHARYKCLFVCLFAKEPLSEKRVREGSSL